jgi:hypothetical protein
MIKTTKRPFDRALYNASDQPARNVIVSYLTNNGHKILDTKEDYNVDIKSIKGDNKYFSEVEIKWGWKGDWNPSWTEIRIPYRKQRLIDKKEKADESNSFLNFYVIRSDLEYAWRIKDTLMIESEVREASGRYITKGEQFFHIPYEKAELIQL